MLSSANSINFGRLVPQVVYYFSAYADLLKTRKIVMGEPVNFVVPTGNFGNILAAYYARNMGLPIHKLICASNRNNVLTEFFATGRYSTHRTFFKTTSPSMDILISSNLERLLFEATDRDSELIRVWMRQLQECGSYCIGDQRREWLADVFYAGCASDRETAWEIKERFEQDHYLMDTHTAVASRVLKEYRKQTQDATVTVLVSTASPYKFSEAVLTALEGEHVAGMDAFACADRLEQLSGIPVPPQVRQLPTLPIRHTAVTPPAQMAEAVMKAYEG